MQDDFLRMSGETGRVVSSMSALLPYLVKAVGRKEDNAVK